MLDTLEDIRSGLVALTGRVDEAIAQLSAGGDDSPHAGAAAHSRGITDLQSPEAWLRLYRFLNLVKKEGEAGIDVDRQRELMRKVGYDPRASGGFFGGNNPSLRRDPQTD